ncbi:hypothetical protein Vadar_000031 [Vaccinium darrowii]|uniref:Uncharacterized protein n=1 Tax=Vaccinium darrowii TaxID=229202 RepID=A0ACB7XWC0_9ERIC|nr:hypothetical protein Vadar_000031 [Vaccinium darrowii]
MQLDDGHGESSSTTDIDPISWSSTASRSSCRSRIRFGLLDLPFGYSEAAPEKKGTLVAPQFTHIEAGNLQFSGRMAGLYHYEVAA